MKLIAKYNRLTIPVIILVFVLGGLAYYFILHNILIHQLDKDLKVEQMEIIRFISKTGALPESSNYKDQVITFQPTKSVSFKERRFSQKIFNPSENEKTAFRSIEFLTSVGNTKYIATVLKSQQETEDIIQLILIITFSIIAILLLTIFLSNRIILNKLWKPFFHTLSQLKQFSLSSNSSIALEKTNIEEFQELNHSVYEMTEKVKGDYESLKNFTENASHEIQTPLAIIKNKIELLIQEEKLDESQMILLQSMNEATSRLSRMNQSLLLLAKIENRQFKTADKINFSSVLLRLVNNLEELAVTKSIDVDIQMVEDFFLTMNESLAEILISNILLNAIKYNQQNGKLKIILNATSLEIVNTGTNVPGNPLLIFDRFTKYSHSGDSLGLGLAIVKTICDAYHFTPSYSYFEGWHSIKIKF